MNQEQKDKIKLRVDALLKIVEQECGNDFAIQILITEKNETYSSTRIETASNDTLASFIMAKEESVYDLLKNVVPSNLHFCLLQFSIGLMEREKMDRH